MLFTLRYWLDSMTTRFLRRFHYVKLLEAEVDDFSERLRIQAQNSIQVVSRKQENGELKITAEAPRELTDDWVKHVLATLQENNAVNYVETIAECEGQKYLASYQRLEGKTPHELREEAERKLEALSGLFCDTMSQWMKSHRTDEEVDFIQGVRRKLSDIRSGVVEHGRSIHAID